MKAGGNSSNTGGKATAESNASNTRTNAQAGGLVCRISCVDHFYLEQQRTVVERGYMKLLSGVIKYI